MTGQDVYSHTEAEAAAWERRYTDPAGDAGPTAAECDRDEAALAGGWS